MQKIIEIEPMLSILPGQINKNYISRVRQAAKYYLQLDIKPGKYSKTKYTCIALYLSGVDSELYCKFCKPKPTYWLRDWFSEENFYKNFIILRAAWH